MIIIGEKLNSSIKSTLQALKDGDEAYIVSLIESQAEHGAQYLDVNTAICEEQELEKMLWVIGLIKKHSDCGIMIDSPSPEVVKAALPAADGRPVMINSVTLTQRMQELKDVIRETGAGIVALPIDDAGIPETVESRLKNSELLVEKLTGYGIAEDKIFIDVLAQAVAVGSENAQITLKTLRQFKEKHPNIQTICGLSNISFGLPERIHINCAFLSAAIMDGLDSAILNIDSLGIRDCLNAALAVAGKDEYCIEYLGYIRSKK